MNSDMHILMCAPDCYDVNYVINPWMEGNVHKSSKARAAEQWSALRDILQGYAHVDLLHPEPGLPDLVFTANAGLVLGNDAVISRFLHPERQGEEPHFKKWFQHRGFAVHELPRNVPFEGAGDALLDRSEPWLWAGHGFRTHVNAHPYLANWLDVEVVSLRLIDNRFYHLDTCFCPLSDGYLMYCPTAFDATANRRIATRIPMSKRIIVEESDATRFACNAVNIGKTVVMNKASANLKRQLHGAGFDVVETDLEEFMKAGGAAKCLTLRTNEPPVGQLVGAGAPERWA